MTSNQHLLSLHNVKLQTQLKEPVIQDLGSLSKEPEISKSQSKKLQKNTLKQSYKTKPASKDDSDHVDIMIETKPNAFESKKSKDSKVRLNQTVPEKQCLNNLIK